MNYLAHFYLAQPTPPSRLGNLMGDFLQSVTIESPPITVQRGIQNHKAVDKFTGAHPVFRDLRAQFNAEQRRFASIMLDIVFDTMLIRHWDNFAAELWINSSTIVTMIYALSLI